MTPGTCSACHQPAEMAPSGNWWHVGDACPNRSQFVFQVAVIEDGTMRSTTDAERPARFLAAAEPPPARPEAEGSGASDA